jgi:hypothetical protein
MTPDILPAFGGPFVSQFAHPGAGGDRINRDYFTDGMRHIRGCGITVEHIKMGLLVLRCHLKKPPVFCEKFSNGGWAFRRNDRPFTR